MTDLLHVHDLSLAFGRAAPTVRGLSFELAPGESLGLSGASGAGKTMLVHSLLGLGDPAVRVVSGHAAYQTKEGMTLNLYELSQRERARLRGREIGMVFQEPQRALNPVRSVGEQLREGVRSLGPAGGPPEAQVQRILEQVELSATDRLLRALPSELSGGQLQRVVIAMALLGRPRLLIADEPTTALDAITRAAIVRLLYRLRTDLHLSLLFITHDTPLLRQVTDRIISLDGAKASASPQSVRTPAEPQEWLSVTDLTVGYGTASAPVLSGLDLKIGRGEWVAVTGPSGCGKTTLAQWAVGLVRGTGGQVRTPLASVRLPAGPQEVRRLTLAQLIFQDIDGSLNPRLTVAEHLQAVPGMRSRAQVSRMLAQVGLEEKLYAGRRVAALSGGQRQRLAIARALATRPHWLICDEAFSALDDRAWQQIMELLVQLLPPAGVSVLFITHDIRRMATYIDRLLVMDGGAIVESGPPEHLLRNPGHPLTRQLVAAALPDSL